MSPASRAWLGVLDFYPPRVDATYGPVVLRFFAAGLGCRCSWRHLVLKKTRQREPAGFDFVGHQAN